MSEKLIKNIEHATPLSLKELVQYDEGKVASMTLAQETGVGITVFAFDAGEGVSTHSAPGDAMVQILEVDAEITIDGEKHILKEGEIIVMPKNIPHAVKAVTRFKMILTVVK